VGTPIPPARLCLPQIQAIDYCYFPIVSVDLKSFDIQTIYAKIGLTSGVSELARYIECGLLPVILIPSMHIFLHSFFQ
jgi:hypothetical protein